MRILFVCLLLGGLQTLHAQKKPLIIGEKIPYNRLIRIKDAGGLTLSGLQGKPMIIDLFTSSCVVCFQMMPKVNKLQEQFRGRLQFLLLGYQDEKIERIYQKFEKHLQLKMQVGFDSIFFRQFQVGPFPMYIWLRANGRVAAITGPDELTASNIDLLIANKELPFASRTENIPFDYFKPYQLNGNGGPDSNYFVRSVIGPWDPAQSYWLPETRVFNDSGHAFNVIGAHLGHLYNYAYWGKTGWGVLDSLYGKVWLNPVVENNGTWKADKYCYSASYKGEHVPDLAIIMKKDLESFFGFEARIETREMPCYVLRLRQPGLSRSNADKKKFEMTHASLTLKSRQILHLMQALHYYDYTQIPFIDETGIDYLIDLAVDAVLTDQADFFAALRMSGIIVEKRSRPMKVLVLRSKKEVAAKK